ncbi:uncharacterized protein LOC129564775 [Sitodiplosis mosellana]|uniref:uncharacterized protein LOC129564775 n=1 Tax=Sitodiplosis mosellana TaxID=263140 RepID=UPI002444CF59|nr:uncharacterized protein LOC129564775 [Sitodiplosis mosellana]
MDNLTDQMGLMSDDLIEECSEDSDDHHTSKHAPLREQDRFLPIANIAKIMKRAIPENGKIAKEARECIQECVSEFISFITSEASERCQNEKRKTINGEDILYAMCALGFDNYVDPLTLYLHKYRETTKTDRNINEASNSNTTIINTNGTVANTNATVNNISAASGSVVLGQIGESILYYDSQNQQFQL